MDKIIELLNKSVVTYRAASWYGQSDFKCVEILMEVEIFEELEKLLGADINGRLDKRYEGRELCK